MSFASSSSKAALFFGIGSTAEAAAAGVSAAALLRDQPRGSPLRSCASDNSMTPKGEDSVTIQHLQAGAVLLKGDGELVGGQVRSKGVVQQQLRQQLQRRLAHICALVLQTACAPEETSRSRHCSATILSQSAVRHATRKPARPGKPTGKVRTPSRQLVSMCCCCHRHTDFQHNQNGSV